MPDADFSTFFTETKRRYVWIHEETAARLAHAYGTRIDHVIGAAAKTGDLGEPFGSVLFVAELDYLKRREWAMSADDVLWRRSKLGLQIDEAGKSRVQDWSG